MITTPRSPVLARPLVLINQRSGTAMRLSSGDCERRVRERFAFHEIDAEIRCVPPASLNAELTRNSGARPTCLIIGGGDGSVIAGAVAARDQRLPLGILPLGTFNHAARDLQMPLELEDAVDALVGGHVREVDLAAVNGRPFLCVCILGFYPELGNPAEERRGSPWWVKAYVYFSTTCRSFVRYPRHFFTIKTDRETLRLRSRFIAVSNNAYLDTAGVMPKKSGLDGGSLAVYASSHTTLGEVAKASLAFFTGRLKDEPEMHTLQATKVEIACARRRVALMVDGEVVREPTPLAFSIDPRALQVIVPAEFKTP